MKFNKSFSWILLLNLVLAPAALAEKALLLDGPLVTKQLQKFQDPQNWKFLRAGLGLPEGARIMATGTDSILISVTEAAEEAMRPDRWKFARIAAHFPSTIPLKGAGSIVDFTFDDLGKRHRGRTPRSLYTKLFTELNLPKDTKILDSTGKTLRFVLPKQTSEGAIARLTSRGTIQWLMRAGTAATSAALTTAAAVGSAAGIAASVVMFGATPDVLASDDEMVRQINSGTLKRKEARSASPMLPSHEIGASTRVLSGR